MRLSHPSRSQARPGFRQSPRIRLFEIVVDLRREFYLVKGVRPQTDARRDLALGQALAVEREDRAFSDTKDAPAKFRGGRPPKARLLDVPD